MVTKLSKFMVAPLLLAMSASNVLAAPPTAENNLSNPKISSHALSPDGKYVAYVAPVGETDVFTVAKVDGLEPVFTTQMGDKRYVGEYRWASDDRLMLWPAKRYGSDPEKRFTGEVQAVNYDGSQNVKLWGYDNRKGIKRLGQLTLENTLKSDPEHVVIETIEDRWANNATRVLRKINIYDGRISNIERSSLPLADFVVDSHGQAVLQWGIDEDTQQQIANYKTLDGQWQTLPNGHDYQAAWALDEQHLLLKRMNDGDNNKLVKFNRANGQLSEVEDSVLAQLSDQMVHGDNLLVAASIKNFGQAYSPVMRLKSLGHDYSPPLRTIKSKPKSYNVDHIPKPNGDNAD